MLPEGESLPTLPTDDLAGEIYGLGESCTDQWTNGMYDVYRWTLTDNDHPVYLYVDTEQGDVTSAELSRERIADHLANWEYEGELAEWLAQWDINGLSALHVIEEDDEYDGPCRVWHQSHYHDGYGTPSPAGFARQDDEFGEGDILEFASRAEAQAYVDEYYNEPSGYDGVAACNVLSHNQYACDTLTIVQAD